MVVRKILGGVVIARPNTTLQVAKLISGKYAIGINLQIGQSVDERHKYGTLDEAFNGFRYHILSRSNIESDEFFLEVLKPRMPMLESIEIE